MNPDLSNMLAYKLRALAGNGGSGGGATSHAELAQTVYRMLEMERQAKAASLADEGASATPLYTRHRRNLHLVTG
jgi:hypothetical protein